MNLQEQFDHVLKNLREQGKPSRMNGACLYRCGDLKCAAGWLLPDECYIPEIESNSWNNVVEILNEYNVTIPEYLLTGESRALISALQQVHDGADKIAPNTSFEDGMFNVAKRFNLIYKSRGEL